MLIIFYIALIVTIATVFVVAIKGFLELRAPIVAARKEKAATAKNSSS